MTFSTPHVRRATGRWSRPSRLLTLIACATVAACSSGTSGSSGSGGANGSGGASASGGSGSGGASATGSGAATGSGGTSGPGSGGATAGSGGRGSGGASGGGSGTGGRGGGAGGRGGAGSGGSAGRGSGGASVGTGGRTGTLRVMPLGDSTTASICYRSHLWQMLTQAGHTQFDFTGTRNGDPGCSFTAYDKDNEGHGGYIVSDVLKATSTGRPGGADTTDPYDSSAKDLMTWFDGHPADVVIMHFGTNDVWNNIAPSTILNAYSAILARLRLNNPNVSLYVAQITPLAPAGCTTCAAGVPALNGLIPMWAQTNSMPGSPIHVVDQYTGFNPATDTVDGVHSNDAGSVKIATNWFNALAPLF